MKNEYSFQNEDWFKTAISKINDGSKSTVLHVIHSCINECINQFSDHKIRIEQQKKQVDSEFNMISRMHSLAENAYNEFKKLENWIKENNKFAEFQFKSTIINAESVSKNKLEKIIEKQKLIDTESKEDLPLFSELESCPYKNIKEVLPRISKCLYQIVQSSDNHCILETTKNETDELALGINMAYEFYTSFKEAVELISVLCKAPDKYQKTIVKLIRQECSKVSSNTDIIKTIINEGETSNLICDSIASFLLMFNNIKSIEKEVKRNPLYKITESKYLTVLVQDSDIMKPYLNSQIK